MKNRSLLADLSRWLFVASLVCALVGGALSAGIAYFNAEELQDSMLREIARWVPSGARQDPYWHRERHDEQVLVQPLGKEGYLRLSSNLQPGFYNIVARGDLWRVLVVQPSGTDQAFAVAQETELRAELAGQSALLALLPIVFLAAGFFLLARWVLVRGLAPVRALAKELDTREPLSLQPLSDAGIADEILPFTRAINRLLQRTREGLQKQQRFIADAAHELRTPVAGLNLLAENAYKGQKGEEQNLMRQGLQRLESLVAQLLDLARLQADHQTSVQVLDADVLLKELIVSVHPLSLEKGVDLGVVQVEPMRVEDTDLGLAKIFQNGLSNAIRYTPKNGQIDVSLFADGADMVFRVDDSGPGIEPNSLKAVFEPFNRGERVGNEGNGLGLAIAQQVANRAGGRLTLQNRDNGGLRYEYRQRREHKPG